MRSTDRDVVELARWLTRLGVLCAAAMPASEAALRAKELAVQLIQEFPPTAFSDESLHAMAGEFRFFPSYAELHAKLEAWWGQHQPQRPALTGPINATRPWMRRSDEGTTDYQERRSVEAK